MTGRFAQTLEQPIFHTQHGQNTVQYKYGFQATAAPDLHDAPAKTSEIEAKQLFCSKGSSLHVTH